MVQVTKPFRLINIAALLQQRYVLPVAFLFYLHNGLTLSDFILFQSIFYAVSLVSEVPAGYIGDIFPRKVIMILSYLLYVFRIIAWLCFGGYYGLLFGEVFFGLSKAFSRGVCDSYIYDYLKSKNMSSSMIKRFGKYNFFLSAASAIGGMMGAFLYKHFENFYILLVIELILNITAITLICFLPNVSHKKVHADHFILHLQTVFCAFKNTLKNPNINLFIFYSAILTGTSNLLAWNFQPTMKAAHVPVILFGVLHLINHGCRAIFSLFAPRAMQKISYAKLSLLTGITHTGSFILLFLNQIVLNPVICFISLVLICFSIGLQMIYYVATTARVHDFIASDTRATSSSVLTMFAALFSSLFLYLFKEMANRTNLPQIYLIFTLLFMVTCYIFQKAKQKRLS